VAIYIGLKKLADDGAKATYGFSAAGSSQRTLVFDRDEERIWPEDGVEDATFHAAARTVAKAWRERGNELPDTLSYQA
jgi:hypothetical protein